MILGKLELGGIVEPDGKLGSMGALEPDFKLGSIGALEPDCKLGSKDPLGLTLKPIFLTNCGIFEKPPFKNRNGRKTSTKVIIALNNISRYCFFSKYRKPKRTGKILKVAANANDITANILLYLFLES